MFIVGLLTIAKIWKQPKCLISREWIKKLWHTYTMEYYLAVIQKEIFPSVTAWMDLESVILSVISQSEKDKYYIISLICGLYRIK